VSRARNAYLIAIPRALALIAAGGWLLAQRALRPVRALTTTAERVTAKGLDQRIPVSREDEEFMRLIGVFNEMLDRLEKSFKQAVRFSADAAHELKTPLTILQGELEQALQAAEAGSSAQQLSSSLLEEVQRLKSIIRKLLLLSLADAGQLKLNLEPLNFSEMLESACEDVQILAPELTVQSEVEEGVWIEADHDLLVQLVQNLTNNAIKYNRPGGKIGIQLKRDGQTVRFTIMNTGTSIPREDREKVFDRFYRADPSRNRKVDGAGLGLSLAKEIARAHRGELTLQDTPDGVIAFRLTLAAYDAARTQPTEPLAQTPRSLPDSTLER
ncbi:MAG: HAMP domain-containing protein, partial [Candidatus Hydrogenedentes bacterium]|nr:HAMP domain-containing protein [Candidatus Hydrogenedentota bacterium]